MGHLTLLQQDDNEERDMIRPVIEDHLGRHSDTEADEPLSARSSKTDTQSELENTVVNSLSFQHLQQQNVEQVNTPSAQLVETRNRLEVLACTSFADTDTIFISFIFLHVKIPSAILLFHVFLEV